MAVCAGAVLSLLTLGASSLLFGDIGGMQAFYFVTAAAVLAVLAHGLGALRIIRLAKA
jgi:hypothetical protein